NGFTPGVLDLTDLESIREFQSIALREFEAIRDMLCELDALRNRPGADFKTGVSSPMISTLLPRLSELRAIARLLDFAALGEHDGCNDGQAVEYVITGLDVASHTRRGEMFLIGDLVAAAIDSLMVEAIATMQPALLVDGAGDGGAAARARVQELIRLLLDEDV